MHAQIKWSVMCTKYELAVTKILAYATNVNKLTYSADNNYNDYNYMEMWSLKFSWDISWGNKI